MDTMWEGEYGTNRENNLKTHTLPYVKQTAGGKLLYNTGSLTLRSVTTQKAGTVSGVGGRGQRYTYGCFTQLYSRNQQTLVKQLSPN